MTTTLPNRASDVSTQNPFRVMVVDDSAIIRGFLSRYLSEDPEVDVVTTANNGEIAIRQLGVHKIEVVVLDIEMPVMDGMTALPKMLEKQPGLQVVMASTLTLKNAEISLRALQMGAVDYVPKPETARSVNANIDFRRELVEKVKAWARRSRDKRGEEMPVVIDPSKKSHGVSFIKPAAERSSGRPAASGFVTAARPSRPAATVVGRAGGNDRTATGVQESGATAISLRKGSLKTPKILAVGSSTGGPQALMKFFGQFQKPPKVPVVITQHMPANFTAILANHLGQATGWPSKEAVHGEEVQAGHIYVAPGGKHLILKKEDNKILTILTDDAPENFCKPAVDPLFRSLSDIYGDAALAVVLTGMGHDGLKGARDLTQKGGTVYAQDEASSVVWGMPGAVATAGLCTQVLPLDQLGAKTFNRLQGGA
ncbi:chemotaxis response regulator protein-glutamate methylesterase of group 2 operon [Kordiimonas sediminis]|uniref:Protein-glutamate methylesterase/protein-glutamine glutaminase n=1 Tax=Kordiimonas sediminis TaxID=1735581 RepID=A0A919AS14_9PROT|nr:chemotaxis response regulator protein-glutamate methylesterase [Kordiimonas sediminis]GHF22501.1 chemotaxis response regulator protein-glutamate methylesterase of group 2 operon [Kordiimonas sediminis]